MTGMAHDGCCVFVYMTGILSPYSFSYGTGVYMVMFNLKPFYCLNGV